MLGLVFRKKSLCQHKCGAKAAFSWVYREGHSTHDHISNIDHADDTLLLSETPMDLQRSLDCLNAFSVTIFIGEDFSATQSLHWYETAAIEIASEYNNTRYIVFSTSGFKK